MHESVDDETYFELMSSGYVIIRDVLSEEFLKNLKKECSPLISEADYCVGDFYGENTKRVGGLFKKSPLTIDLALNPICLSITDKIFSLTGSQTRLSFSQLISVFPGEREQEPHIDQSMWPLDHKNLIGQIGFIWPLDSFTDTNGSTIIYPKSHTNPDLQLSGNKIGPIKAVLSPGSVLVFLGNTVHHAGANRSCDPRSCIMISYCLSWLMPFENPWLTYPPEVAQKFPRLLTDLLGYKIQSQNLGNVNGFCPSGFLENGSNSRTRFTNYN